MNPTKIELPENLIKKLETETNLFNNSNGLIQGKNLILNDNLIENNSNRIKINNSNDTNNSSEDALSNNSNEGNTSSKFKIK
jgi:hypothetical protein